MTTTARSQPWGWAPAARLWLAGTAFGLAAGLAVASRPGGSDVAPASDPTLVVDPNSAPTGVLEALPRLGPTLARRIAAERQRAPFASAADLDARVRGIGPATIQSLRPHLHFESKAGSTEPVTP